MLESPRLARLARVAKLTFTPLAVFFLLLFGWTARHVIADVLRTADLGTLGLSVVLWIAIQPLVPTMAKLVVSSSHAPVSWGRLMESHAARLPARYLPGGIWHTVGRVADLRAQSVDAQRLTALVVVEHGVALAVTFTAGGALLALFTATERLKILPVAGVIVGVTGLLLVPFVVRRIVGVGCTAATPSRYAAILFTSVLFWAGASAAFTTYLSAFQGVLAGTTGVEAAGVYLLSWACGFLAVFAPQGVGVFELVAGELLATPIGLAGTAVLIAGFRAVVLCADVMTWTVFAVLRRTGYSTPPP